VKDALEKAVLGGKIEESSVQLIPQTTVKITPEQAKAVQDLIDELEDSDDVQKVYTNADWPDDDEPGE
jgi:transcriptional/translational regulatory protein YebC/TACO1